MAKMEGAVKILIDIDKVLGEADVKELERAAGS